MTQDSLQNSFFTQRVGILLLPLFLKLICKEFRFKKITGNPEKTLIEFIIINNVQCYISHYLVFILSLSAVYYSLLKFVIVVKQPFSSYECILLSS